MSQVVARSYDTRRARRLGPPPGLSLGLNPDKLLRAIEEEAMEFEIHERACCSMKPQRSKAARRLSAALDRYEEAVGYTEEVSSDAQRELDAVREQIANERAARIVHRITSASRCRVPQARAVLRCRVFHTGRTRRAVAKKAAATSTGDPDPEPDSGDAFTRLRGVALIEAEICGGGR